MKKKTNFNKNRLAELICATEGGKQNLSIAQVKEVLKCLTWFIENDPKWLVVLLK